VKPLQYREAAKVGLKTSDTLVSNSPGIVRDWLSSRPDVVSKTLSSPIISIDDDVRGFSFTHVLDDVDREELDAVAITPTQFQNLVRPSYEVRVTSIAGRHFAVRIDSDQGESLGVRDWRSERISTTYSWWDLPLQVEHALNALLLRLGLSYAASDFIVTEGGEYIFLEANPHGAWLWLEDALEDDRITQAFAETISKACKVR
jgi:hypothetical protein